jgi:GAF domain-containing protein
VADARQRAGVVRSMDDCLGELISASCRIRSRTELFREFAAGVACGLSADLTQALEYDADGSDLVLRAGHGFREDLHEQVRVPSGLLSQAGRALLDPMGRPVELEDFSKAHDWADDALLLEHGAKSGIVVKITSGARDFGTLGAFYLLPRSFASEEIRFLVRATSLLGSELERLALEREVVAWRSRYELLRAGYALLPIPTGRDDLFSAAASVVVNGGCPMADWCFADAVEGEGVLPKLSRVAVERTGGAAEHLEEAFSAPLSPNVPHGAPRAYATRQTELVRRVDSAFIFEVARNAKHRRAIEEAKPYSYICAPVIGAGRFHGAITLLRTEAGNPTPFDDEDREAVSEFAALVGHAIEIGMPEAREAKVMPSFVGHNLELTAREHDVLEGIASGARLNQIGRSLSISESTVRTHKRHLCQKLDLAPSDADTEIVAEAERRGISGLRN